MNQPSSTPPLTVPSDAELDRADAFYWESWELVTELQDVISSTSISDASYSRKLAELRAAEHRLHRAADDLHRIRSQSPETLALNSRISGRTISSSRLKAIRLSSKKITGPRARSSRGSSSRTQGSRRTAGRKAPPGDDGGGDPEPPGLKLEAGGQTDKSTITSIGGRA